MDGTPAGAMSGLLDDLVRRGWRDSGLLGMVVFGSFARGEVRETSDLDLLMVREDIEESRRTRERRGGVLLDLNVWPRKLFERPFTGETGDLYADAFAFAVMRSGRILYDPTRALREWRGYALSHRLPGRHVLSLVDRARRSLTLSGRLLDGGALEAAELEMREASESLLRAVLLRKDVPEIIPPKRYLPHARRVSPGFFHLFAEVNRLDRASRGEIEDAVGEIAGWRERAVGEIRRRGREEWLEGAVVGAVGELGNARDCLAGGDLEAALLQARYAAILVASPVLRLLRGSGAETAGERYLAISRFGHPYAGVMRSIMHFCGDGARLEEFKEKLLRIIKLENLSASESRGG